MMHKPMPPYYDEDCATSTTLKMTEPSHTMDVPSHTMHKPSYMPGKPYHSNHTMNEPSHTMARLSYTMHEPTSLPKEPYHAMTNEGWNAVLPTEMGGGLEKRAPVWIYSKISHRNMLRLS